MNADAEFIKLLKDEADEAEWKSNEAKIPTVQVMYASKVDTLLYLLKSLGITYTPNSRKDRE